MADDGVVQEQVSSLEGSQGLKGNGLALAKQSVQDQTSTEEGALDRKNLAQTEEAHSKFHAAERMQDDILLSLIELQRFLQGKKAFQCFQELIADIDEFVALFSSSVRERTEKNKGTVTADMIEHQCAVGKQFIKLKHEEMVGIDRFIAPLLSSGFQYVKVGEQKDSSDEASTTFVVNIASFYETVGVELFDALKAFPSGAKTKKKSASTNGGLTLM